MTESEIPTEAIILMKMALGLIDAAGGGRSAVARHLNAAVELALVHDANMPQLALVDPAAAPRRPADHDQSKSLEYPSDILAGKP